EMRCASGPRDQHADPAPARRLYVLDERLRRAVRGEDVDLVLDLEAPQTIGRRLERVPITVAAHQDPDLWLPVTSCHDSPPSFVPAPDARCHAGSACRAT